MFIKTAVDILSAIIFSIISFLFKLNFILQMVLDKFRAVEQAVSSLDICCSEVNENEVYKTNQVIIYLIIGLLLFYPVDLLKLGLI